MKPDETQKSQNPYLEGERLPHFKSLSGRESNERIKYLLSIGQTGINMDPDLPTHLGLDPDNPLAQGDVGLQGSSLVIYEDMVDLYRDIPLDQVSVRNFNRSIIRSLTPQQAAGNALAIAVQGQKRKEHVVSNGVSNFGTAPHRPGAAE
jgi:methylmalonyl-CoA mutase N-terminal domain/subunit